MSVSEVTRILKTMRKHNRRAVVLPAELEINGKCLPCTAYDVSLGGVRLKVDMAIAENEKVVVKVREELKQAANVVWSAQGFVGLNFKADPNVVRADLNGLATNLN